VTLARRKKMGTSLGVIVANIAGVIIVISALLMLFAASHGSIVENDEPDMRLLIIILMIGAVGILLISFFPW